jgi:ribosomal protein S21
MIAVDWASSLRKSRSFFLKPSVEDTRKNASKKKIRPAKEEEDDSSSS